MIRSTFHAALLALLAAPLLLAAPAASAQDDSPQLRQLRSDLQSIVREPGWRNAEYGVIVTSVEHGDTLFSLNADQPLAPASVMKIYTTAAALYYLGSDFRFLTYALADGEVENGVLEGNLIMYGTGNPGIASRSASNATSAAHELADSIAALGIREIRGDVVGDGTYFDDVWLGSGWNSDNLMSWYAAPIGALTHGESMVAVRVRAGGRSGDPAEITTTPGTNGLALVNRVRTVTSGNSSVRFTHEDGALVIRGQIRTGHPGVSRFATVVDPANYAAAVLHAALEDRGVRVLGGTRSIRDASESRVAFGSGSSRRNGSPAVLAVHRSISLREIVDVTNQRSHNLFAEALLKTIGRVVLGEGSFRAGEQALQYFLECEAGVPAAALRIVDGSGLSRLNRLTPRTGAHLLEYMTRDPEWEAFYASLPIAAHHPTHSLRNRMGRSAAAGNLRAKTGTIHRVSALSGYVSTRNGEQLAFVIFGNNVPSGWRMKRMEDAIGIRLAEFSRPAPPRAAPVVAVEEEDEEVPADGGPAEEVPPVRRPAPAPVTLDIPDHVAEPLEEEEPEPATPTFRDHIVAQGEVLGRIAGQHGVTVAEIEEANPGLDARRIRPGQTIRIPVDAPPEESEPAAEPDPDPATEPAEARRAPEPEERPARRPAPVPVTLDPPAPIRAAPEEADEEIADEAEAETTYREHTVRSGEVLGRIAGQYGVTVRQIEEANPGLDARRIRVGQTIRIPARDGNEGTAARSAPRTHTIGAGENFTVIARRYGITVGALQEANPGVDSRRIRPGQTLRIPD